jgi:hypothetical protein
MVISSRMAHAFGLRPRNATLATSAVLLLAVIALAGSARTEDHRLPDLGDCQDLHVPPRSKLDFQAYCVGVQIYTWTGTTWSFVSPEALLFADPADRALVGFHFAGPTWESLSGSKVVGTVAKSCTPNPDAIPWLLVKAVSNEGHGIFQRVSYIQRLFTAGGKAPATPGDFPGQVARVPYTAEYFFYQSDR